MSNRHCRLGPGYRAERPIVIPLAAVFSYGAAMVELCVPSPATSSHSLRAAYTPLVNLAMQQNAVPLLHTMTVTDFSDKRTNHISVRVWSEPPLLAEKTPRVDDIAAGADYTLSDLVLTLLRSPLRKLPEREEGHLGIEVAVDGVRPEPKPFPPASRMRGSPSPARRTRKHARRLQSARRRSPTRSSRSLPCPSA